jgi:hypothetical protein
MKFSTNASLIFVAAFFLGACAAKSSDEQQVRELIASAEAAAEARDTSDVLELVADDYNDAQGFDKPSLQNFLRAYFLQHPQIELIVSIEKLEFPVPGLAQAEISVATVGSGDANLQHLNVELRKSGDDWHVSRADRLQNPEGHPICEIRHRLRFNREPSAPLSVCENGVIPSSKRNARSPQTTGT